MLSAHYRSPLNFNEELMEAAKSGYERIVTSVSNLNYLMENASSDQTALTDEEKSLLNEAKNYVARFNEAMDDDFNTADAISVIFELVKFANTHADASKSIDFITELKKEIIELSEICGLIVEKKEELLDSDIEKLIEDRQTARKEKNFARADEIRKELLDKGIVLEDTREGVKWKRA